MEGSGHVPPLKRCTDFGGEHQVEVLPPVARLLFEFLLVLPLDVEYFLQLRCEGNGSASCFCFRSTDLQGGSAGIVLVKVAVPANRLDAINALYDVIEMLKQALSPLPPYTAQTPGYAGHDRGCSECFRDATSLRGKHRFS